MNIPDKNKIQIYLKNLASQEFNKAPTYKKLLRYLVDATLEGKKPKEISIAYDLFYVHSNHEKYDDSKVRVYIHNLRKKLNSYYINEGQNDEIQFEIPKGDYRVNFVEKSEVNKFFFSKLFFYIGIIILLVTLLGSISLNVYFLRKNKLKIFVENSIEKNNPVWKDYFNSELPILIVLGDYFLYKDTLFSKRPRYIRDVRINSQEDLEKFLNNNSYKNQIILTKHTFLGKFAPWCLYDLLKLLMPINSKIELKLASQLQWTDLNKYNIIFVGTFKTLRILEEITKNLHFTYEIKPNMLYYHSIHSDTLYSYHATRSDRHPNYETDYAVIAKFNGPNANTITMFISTRDIGCLATVAFLTRPQFLNPFINKYIKKSNVKYFEAIFEVQGYERVVINTKLLHFNIL